MDERAFASVLLEIKTAAGAIDMTADTSVGESSVMNVPGVVTAQMTPTSTALAMASTFGAYSRTAGACSRVPCGPSAPFSSTYIIMTDVGIGCPAGIGLSFVTIRTVGSCGTTSVALLWSSSTM